MSKFIALILAGVLTAGCAVTSEASLSDRISRLEATYTAGLEVLITNRELCVEQPDSNSCVVDDEVALEVEKVREKVADLIDEAQLRAELGDDEARSLYDEAVNQFADITKYIDKVKDLVGG